MSKILSILSLLAALCTFSVDVNAAHCSGGHKEIKDSKDSSSDDSKQTKGTKSN